MTRRPRCALSFNETSTEYCRLTTLSRAVLGLIAVCDPQWHPLINLSFQFRNAHSNGNTLLHTFQTDINAPVLFQKVVVVVLPFLLEI